MSPEAHSPRPAQAPAPDLGPQLGARDSRLFDALFVGRLATVLGVYLALIAGLLVALGSFTSPSDLARATQSEEIRYAFWLSLETCTLATILSLWIAVPSGYLLSRFQVPRPRRRWSWRDGGSWLAYFLQNLLDALLDIPIVLPPLVIGLALLILFQTSLGKAVERVHPVTFDVPAVILAQFTVACAFAVRTMRVTFDQISPRSEQVALTLGCSRRQAFWLVVFPEARRGLVTAATLSWARSLGEFGPILVFAGATRMRTEVLPTTVFLELSVGNIEAAAAVSLIMVAAALAVLLLTRAFGLRGTGLI
ncbi:MAG: ABC transporter permease [Thermoguttaceae bacterium]|jgi:molybdate transport system permease protein|nr:ABC transporter permease [Thermoguttaceae bacterium]